MCDDIREKKGHSSKEKIEHEEEDEDEEKEIVVNDDSPEYILHMTVCRALLRLKKNDLPMSTSKFFSQYVLSTHHDNNHRERRQLRRMQRRSSSESVNTEGGTLEVTAVSARKTKRKNKSKNESTNKEEVKTMVVQNNTNSPIDTANRTTNIHIDMKQTRYKRFGCYLQEQVQRGLIRVGPESTKSTKRAKKKNNDKNNDNSEYSMSLLLSYQRKHPDLKHLIAEQIEKEEEETQRKKKKNTQSTRNAHTSFSTKNDGRDDNDNDECNGNINSTPTLTRVAVLQLYMVPLEWQKLLRFDRSEIEQVIVDAGTATSTATTRTTRSDVLSERRRMAGMFSSTEINKILDMYLDKRGRSGLMVLVKKSSSSNRPTNGDDNYNVRLDHALTKILYSDNEIEERYNNGTTSSRSKKDNYDFILFNSNGRENETVKRKVISRQSLLTMFLEKLPKAYAIIKTPGNKILSLSSPLSSTSPAPPMVTIRITKVPHRYNNTFVTRVRGLEQYGIDLKIFSKYVSKRFGCSSSIKKINEAKQEEDEDEETKEEDEEESLTNDDDGIDDGVPSYLPPTVSTEICFSGIIGKEIYDMLVGKKIEKKVKSSTYKKTKRNSDNKTDIDEDSHSWNIILPKSVVQYQQKDVSSH